MKLLSFAITCLFAFNVLNVNGLAQFRKLQFESFFQISNSASNEAELWIEQKLDNFHSSDHRTWMQRYFMRDTLSKSSGPVFLNIGGEGPANPIWMTKGHWITMAEQTGAMCFMIEHRFYGKSKPTSDASTENLSFLSSQQALADIANFIVNMTDKYNLQGRKWIVFGGSYSGALSIWARLKYPHLVSGSVSSSAPLNALVDFAGYLEVVDHSLTQYGSSSCTMNLAAASNDVASHLKTAEGRKYLQSKFKLCDPLSDDKWDDENFQEALAGNIMGVVQYNRDNRNFEGGVGGNITVEQLCKTMDDSSLGSMLQRYAEINRYTLEAYQIKCLDASYNNFLRDMRNESWAAATGARQWVYQTCTEFGWYQTTDSLHQPFIGFPLKFAIDQCQSVYGITAQQVSEAVMRSNEYYGAFKVAQVVTNVTLYNGGVDPWSNVSYTNNQYNKDTSRGLLTMFRKEKSGIRTVFVTDTAHCAIMYPASPSDSPLLKQARLAVESTVREWLGIAGSNKITFTAT